METKKIGQSIASVIGATQDEIKRLSTETPKLSADVEQANAKAASARDRLHELADDDIGRVSRLLAGRPRKEDEVEAATKSLKQLSAESQEAWTRLNRHTQLQGTFEQLCHQLKSAQLPVDSAEATVFTARREWARLRDLRTTIAALRQAVGAAGECDATARFPLAQLDAIDQAVVAALERSHEAHGPASDPRTPMPLEQALSGDARRVMASIRQALGSIYSNELHPAWQEAVARSFSGTDPVGQARLQLRHTADLGFDLTSGAGDKQIVAAAEAKGAPLTARELANHLLERWPASPLYGDFLAAFFGREFPELEVPRRPRLLTTVTALTPEGMQFWQRLGGGNGQALIDACRKNDDKPLDLGQAMHLARDLRPTDPYWPGHVAQAAYAAGLMPPTPMPAAFREAASMLENLALRATRQWPEEPGMLKSIAATGWELRVAFSRLREQVAASAGPEFPARELTAELGLTGRHASEIVMLLEGDVAAVFGKQVTAKAVETAKVTALESIAKTRVAIGVVDPKERNQNMATYQELDILERQVHAFTSKAMTIVGQSASGPVMPPAVRNALAGLRQLLQGEVAEISLRIEQGGGSPLPTAAKA
ncbi:MAG: hypothetical protein HY903_24610 [Deltaproteobacteria bacterium]|nr:hypothetical protein [Deltaproteobacteria bacterium]